MILIDKTQTVEQKCNCAITEKGVVITLKLGRIDLNFSAKTRLELLIRHTIKFDFLTKFSFTNYLLQIFAMKALWTFSALVLATIYPSSLASECFHLPRLF